MGEDYEITKQHVSGDEEHVAFTFRLGDRTTKAVISRSALVTMDRIPDRHIHWIFEENLAVIAEAAGRKLASTEVGRTLQLGSDDF